MSAEEGDNDHEDTRYDPPEAYFQELQSIQTIIERQANNSSKIKGWTVTLVVAVILFRTGNIQTLLGYVPLVAFWYLDSYYLKQERNYRKLHDWVRKERLDSNKRFFDMNASRFNENTESIFRIMCSKIQIVFYGVIAISLFAFFVFSFLSAADGSIIISILFRISG